jgi:hypothetical protein
VRAPHDCGLGAVEVAWARWTRAGDCTTTHICRERHTTRHRDEAAVPFVLRRMRALQAGTSRSAVSDANEDVRERRLQILVFGSDPRQHGPGDEVSARRTIGIEQEADDNAGREKPDRAEDECIDHDVPPKRADSTPRGPDLSRGSSFLHELARRLQYTAAK